LKKNGGRLRDCKLIIFQKCFIVTALTARSARTACLKFYSFRFKWRRGEKRKIRNKKVKVGKGRNREKEKRAVRAVCA